MRKLLLVLCLSACGESGGTQSVTMTVGQAGGTLTSTSGAKLVVPKDALSQEVAITMADAATPTLSNAVTTGPFFALGPEGQTFATPVEVTLPFDPARLPSGSRVAIYTAPSGSSAFTALVTTQADATHVRASTTHFSTFGTGAPMPTGIGCSSNSECPTTSPNCIAGICGAAF